MDRSLLSYASCSFSLLQKVLDAVPGAVRTTSTYNEWVDGIRKGNNATQSPVVLPELNTLIMKYQDPKQADTIMRVQQELDETKVVMHKTIESVLERGEKLDNLVERSNALSAQSKMFYKTAKKQNSCEFYNTMAFCCLFINLGCVIS